MGVSVWGVSQSGGVSVQEFRETPWTETLLDRDPRPAYGGVSTGPFSM